MDRIALIGCGGSGKSHRAWSLGAALGITPVQAVGAGRGALAGWIAVEGDQDAAFVEINSVFEAVDLFRGKGGPAWSDRPVSAVRVREVDGDGVEGALDRQRLVPGNPEDPASPAF